MSNRFHAIRLPAFAASVILIGALLMLARNQGFDLSALKVRQAELQDLLGAYPFAFCLAFVVTYILITALSIPFATLLTLGAGAIFGFGQGLLLVLIASTCGATLTFLAARWLGARRGRSWVLERWPHHARSIDHRVSTEGWIYLLTLRLMPVFPHFLVNVLMGMTRIRTRVFFAVSLIGMIPMTALYVSAGTQLARLKSLDDAADPRLLLSLALIALLTLVALILRPQAK